MKKRTSPETSRIGCASEVEEVVSGLREFELSDQSQARLADVLNSFASFAERGHRVQALRDIDEAVANAFIHALTIDRSVPSNATMHFRRGALRLMFRLARELSLASGDPTLDIKLPPRSSRSLRPLTDEEVALCRSAALTTAAETRLPAAWAAAEATATSAELGVITTSDVDLDGALIRLSGSTRAEPRYGVPTSWGVKQLARRVTACKRGGRELLLYQGKSNSQSRQAAGCIATSDTLRRAGLSQEPDVGPASLRAWAGVEIFRRTGSIDEVARRLGMRSLDRAAELIGWDWRTDPS